jgi:RimJ/RimL family protein N-acetyltransferase
MSQITSFGRITYPNIPLLETEHLYLRAHKIEDLQPLSNIWANPETTRFIGQQPRARQEIWKQIQRTIGGWSLLGYGYWVITVKSTGTVIGEAGFMEGLRDISPSFIGTPEAGWVIAPAHWNKGYASQALAAIHEWSDVNIAGKRTVCIIEAEHAASIYLAQKVGYYLLHETHIGASPINVYERCI